MLQLPGPSRLKPLFDRVPPSSQESEMALLGSMMLDPAIVPEVVSTVTPDDFDREAHATIFRAIRDNYAKAGSGDLIQLNEMLRDRGELDPVGGVDYLVELVSHVPSSANWPHFARIVVQKSRLRRLIQACGQIVYSAYTGADDADAVITEAFDRVSAVARTGGGRPPTTLQQAQAQVVEQIDKGAPAMYRTGMTGFDGLADGIPRRGVWTIFGFPAGGKTTFALNVALTLASGMRGQLPVPVRVVSFEQSAMRIAATMLAASTGINTHRVLNTGSPLTTDQRGAIEAAMVEQADIDFAVFEENLDPPSIYAEIVRLQRNSPEGVLIVDYLQDLPPFGDFIEQTPRMSEGMRVLARVARELGWLVIVISQVSKAAGKLNEQPQLADGLGSSAIEQRSDLISYVWRPHQREPRPAPSMAPSSAWSGDAVTEAWAARQQRCRVGILKNKFGPCGHVDMAFEGPKMRFRAATEVDLMHWPALKGEAQ